MFAHTNKTLLENFNRVSSAFYFILFSLFHLYHKNRYSTDLQKKAKTKIRLAQLNTFDGQIIVDPFDRFNWFITTVNALK